MRSGKKDWHGQQCIQRLTRRLAEQVRIHESENSLAGFLCIESVAIRSGIGVSLQARHEAIGWFPCELLAKNIEDSTIIRFTGQQ